MIRKLVLVLSLVVLVGTVAGCGSSPKVVTKAQYQKELQRLGSNLTALGSELGRSIDIATFNSNVGKFQDGLDQAAKDLKHLKPPANVEATNKRLVGTNMICVAAPVNRIPEPTGCPEGTARKLTTCPPAAKKRPSSANARTLIPA